jgi:hypothetical protein
MRSAARFLVLVAVGCGGAASSSTVVGPRDVPAASGTPSISAIRDLGDYGPVPAAGQTLAAGDGDGRFVIGELILVEGKNFGKLPTVAVAGQPAETLARTATGAIITRIPPGVPTGAAPVEVSHEGGRGQASIEVIRYALVVQPEADLVHAVEVGAEGALTEAGTLEVTGARAVAFSPDGQVAYVAADGATEAEPASLVVVAVTAGGGPKKVETIPLGNKRAVAVTAAARAPVLAVVGAGAATLVDLAEARYPSVRRTVDLGEIGHVLVDAEMSHDGRLLVLLADEGNLLVPVVVDGATVGAPLSLLPTARVPLVHSMAFSPAGEELWIVAGDNPLSARVGVHRSVLVRVRVQGTALEPAGLSPVADLGPPTALGVARQESILGGTAIRSTSRRAVVVVADLSPALIAAAAGGSLEQALLDARGQIGQLLRADLDGVSRPLHQGDAIFLDVAVTHDVRHAVAAANQVRRDRGLRLDFGLTSVPLEGGEARFVRLGDGARAGDPLAPASLALQP